MADETAAPAPRKTKVQRAQEKVMAAVAEVEQAEVEQAEEAERARVPNDPNKVIGLWDGQGGYSYVDAPEGHDRRREFRVNYSGQNYEHVADDRDGVWLYRAM